ncbi:MAG: hypothetical protein CMM86_09320 [Rhodovulum sp.]|nr:hypothetical protein [Rhodovulum sp.]|tara:strand:+ start:2434 stop:2871 length:438 start_codon:yes stop_codon:yes gene_type:complete
MVDFPEVELQAALIAALDADQAFSAVCPGGVWDGVPDVAVYPYVRLAELDVAEARKGRTEASQVGVSFGVYDRPSDPGAAAPTGGAVRVRRVAAALRRALANRPALLPLPSAKVWKVDFVGSTVGAPDKDGAAGKVAFLVYFNER